MTDIERRIADARAEGYRDGYTQARQRAESRVAQWLPLRMLTFDEIWQELDRKAKEARAAENAGPLGPFGVPGW